MKYRHIRTGREIDIPSVLSDPEWEPVKAPAPKRKKEGAEHERLRNSK